MLAQITQERFRMGSAGTQQASAAAGQEHLGDERPPQTP
jgi:hypothetical protein